MTASNLRLQIQKIRWPRGNGGRFPTVVDLPDYFSQTLGRKLVLTLRLIVEEQFTQDYVEIRGVIA